MGAPSLTRWISFPNNRKLDKEKRREIPAAFLYHFDMNSIAFSGILTLEDYLVSDRLFLRIQPFHGRFDLVWGNILILGVGLALLNGVTDWQRWVTIGLVAGVPFFLFARRSAALRNKWKDFNAQQQTLYSGTFTEQGIEINVGAIRIYTRWEYLEYYQATENVILLYPSPYSVITLTSHFFAQASDWHQLRTWVFQKLSPDFPRGWIDPQLLLQTSAAPLISIIVILMAVYL